jgi:hypothetical protein
MITSALRTSRNLLAVGNVEKNYEVRIIEWAKYVSIMIRKGYKSLCPIISPKLRRKIIH